ncbi:MAG: hypothetical protein HRT88_03610 [Lentisphaeraceae bacterium]|nr:hypothetical protein [Lentisphaeraceae bacterium]
MKIQITLLMGLISLSACSSVEPEKPDLNKKRKTGHYVNVEVIKKGERRNSANGGKSLMKKDASQEHKWQKMKVDGFENKYKTFTTEKMDGLITSASAQDISQMVEVLERRGLEAVAVLAKLLDDKRAVEFSDKDKAIYWYAQKNKPVEDLELRVYAALKMELLTEVNPNGVIFDYHQLPTDKGSVQVLYAVKGPYAVNKDDLCKEWKLWWKKYASEYTQPDE